jgi:signal transduction histidine kinase
MTIKLGIEEDLPQILGDAQHVRTILGHLLDNAYNYTPENGIISTQIRTGEQDDVQVEIKDNGIGILPANQDQVFERFWRGDDDRVLATPGTGLGLPIVRQLVEMHKGKVWLKSLGVPGEGSVFSFTLPKHVARDRKADMRTARLYGEGEDLFIPPKDPPRDLETPGESSS